MLVNNGTITALASQPDEGWKIFILICAKYQAVLYADHSHFCQRKSGIEILSTLDVPLKKVYYYDSAKVKYP